LSSTIEIPLFPLRTVLFPGGFLPLRIFEQRYLKMVRDCASADTGFGVCLIREGEEAVAPVKTAESERSHKSSTGNTLRTACWASLRSARSVFDRTTWQQTTACTGPRVILPEPPACPLPWLRIVGDVLGRFMKRSGGSTLLVPGKPADAVWVAIAWPNRCRGGIEKQHLLSCRTRSNACRALVEVPPRFQTE
jgi:hypothetical protein